MSTSAPCSDESVRESVANSASATESREHRVQRGLSADIRLLGDCLGTAIRRLAGEPAYQLVEEVRAATKDLRTRPSLTEARRLRDSLGTLDLASLRMLVRAFTVYFDLINLAEQRARLRALRYRAWESDQPLADSIESALTDLQRRGIDGRQVVDLLSRAVVVPVFTAHPSEARRRTLFEKLQVIAAHLDELEYNRPTPRECEAARAAIAEEIETFWLTSVVRTERPKVVDEVQQGLGVIQNLFQVVPRLYRDLEAAVQRTYPELGSASIASFLRFGSWIGGDRDGNPFVTHDVTAAAVRLQQERMLLFYQSAVVELGRKLSYSDQLVTTSSEFRASLAADAELFPQAGLTTDHEPHRAKCRAIGAKLERTLDFVRKTQIRWTDEPENLPPGVYVHRDDLQSDLTVLATELERMGALAAARGTIHDLRRAVDVFGLHMLTLDLRQHSNRHGRALAEVLSWAGVAPGYLELTPDERLALLVKELDQTRPLIPAHLPFTPETCEVIQTFRTTAALVEQECPDAIQYYIISNSTEPAHLLEVLLFAREARLFRPHEQVSRLNIVPLFEALEPLVTAGQIMQRLLDLPIYRQHLQLRGDVQEVMIGYSDSNKESGALQSAWALYEAQRELAEIGRKNGIAVQVFHGRGGSIGRGGGPANRAILAQPSHTVDGRLRFTEQGEMIADRYGSSGVAERHLDQIVNAVLRTSFAESEAEPDPAWERLLEQLAERARAHYRALVYETPDFLTYFEQATPIAEIGQLKIGSRPARRGGAVAGIDELRAIPWVFSWMQSRHTLPGWFGLGSAISEHLAAHPDDEQVLRDMYTRWPFWRTLIDNAQMILAKADLTIARLYADLVEDPALADRIFARIEGEYRLTVAFIQRLTGQHELLERVPILQRSIERRNPYVDPLSFIQLVLLKRLRSGDPGREELLTGVLESIKGVSSGLKNTG